MLASYKIIDNVKFTFVLLLPVEFHLACHGAIVFHDRDEHQDL